jgi:photosystem II stability/assembly factor-like uncharacterized protein
VTWYAHDIDSLAVAEDPDELAQLGDYIVIVSADSASHHYILKSDLNAYTDPTATEVTTNYVAAGAPRAIYSTGSIAFIVGNGGYIYSLEDATAAPTVLSAGGVVVDDLLKVHALSDVNALAVGNNGAVVYTEDGSTWTAATRPVGAGIHLNSGWMVDERTWYVVTSTGLMYYTLDKGVTWTQKSFPGSGSGVGYDIKFPTRSVGYMSHSTSTPRGRVLRTIDGGYSWAVLPESAGSFPLNDRMGALAVCDKDPNFMIAAGLADDAADGFIALGSSA